ncbi:MAG: protein translocase subunit SecD [Candidatus Hydrogenedentes bacterium]|nr:protein translocase subunit SecD [Candidatus Hydrogenedentota bacterium]
MRRNPYITLLIWIVIIWSIIQVYPTLGWLMLSDDARQARLEKWRQEDDEWAKKRHSYYEELWKSIRRWAEFDRNRVINLGLDLMGGIHMVLRFDINDLPPERLQEYRDRGYSDSDIEKEVQQVVLQQITRRINEFEAREPIIQALGNNQIQIQLPGEKNVERAKNLAKRTAQLNFHIVAEMSEIIQVFQKIKEKYPEEFNAFIMRPKMKGDYFTVRAENFERVGRLFENAKKEGLIPEGKTIAFSQPPKPYEEQVYKLYLIDATPIASGEGLRSAIAIPDQDNPPNWKILFEFNNAAGARFGEATGNNIGKPMAIVLDGMVCSAPVIRDRITTRGEITGNFEQAEATDLAIALNSGSMVVPVKEEFTRIVGASLGADAVHRSVISAVVALAIVSAFMVVYYLWAGVIALVTLVVNFLIILALMAYFEMTLTLPGVAGLILTIGMAVDANILIYERIREELKLGHALTSAISNGFTRSTATILDANITTLIAAAVLLQFGTGPIEGFAITLSIGVCATIFASLVVCRALFDFLVEKKIIKSLPMLALIPMKPKIPFLELRYYAFTISGIVIVIGMTIFGLRGRDNLGVDFVEGTNINVQITNDLPIQPGSVREALTKAGLGKAIVQLVSEAEAEAGNRFLIRIARTDIENLAEATKSSQASTSQGSGGGETQKSGTEQSSPQTLVNPVEDIGTYLQNALASLTKSGSSSDVVIEDQQTVGPAVGAQLRSDAIKCVIWSFLFIIIYLWFRFELKFGVAAVLALVHDVLVTLGAFAVLKRQIDMGVVAAILTIIGYSLNDTIVVFDRVRENLRLYRGKGYKYIEILNMSINQTLSRTLLTALTTLFSVVVLIIFGGLAIRDFAFALLVGITVGTYSSIFVASPIVLIWEGINERRQLRLAEESKVSSKKVVKAKSAKAKA